MIRYALALGAAVLMAAPAHAQEIEIETHGPVIELSVFESVTAEPDLVTIGAGVTSFIAHAGGPVASIYLLSRDMTKEQYQATTIVTFWVNNLIKIVLYVWLGILSLQTTVAAAYLLPFAVIGTYLGVRLNRIVPEKLYFTLIYVFLTIAGTKLIFDALA